MLRLQERERNAQAYAERPAPLAGPSVPVEILTIEEMEKQGLLIHKKHEATRAFHVEESPAVPWSAGPWFQLLLVSIHEQGDFGLRNLDVSNKSFPILHVVRLTYQSKKR